MRKLFIPLAKLLGIYFLYRPLTYMTYIFYYLFSSFFSEQSAIRMTFLYNSIVQLLILFLALALLFKTEKIADLIRLPDDGINLTNLDSHSIFRTGLILVGVGALIYAIPNFFSSFVIYLTYRDDISMLFFQQMDKMVFSIIQAILGVIFIFKSRPITRFFDEKESSKF